MCVKGEVLMLFFQRLRLVRAIRYKSLTPERILAINQFLGFDISGRRGTRGDLLSTVVSRVNKWCYRLLLVETSICPFLIAEIRKFAGELEWYYVSLFTLCWFIFLYFVDTILGWFLFMKWANKQIHKI